MASPRIPSVALLGSGLLIFVAGAAPPQSPLDAIDPKTIPADERTEDLLPETVAILGSNRGRHANAAKCVAVSPDGRWIASGSRDETVRIWSPADLRVLQILSGHREDVDAVCFSSDSKRLYSVGWDGNLRLWVLEGGRWKSDASIPLGGDRQTAYFAPGASRLFVASSERGKGGFFVNKIDDDRLTKERFLGGLHQWSDAMALSPDQRYFAAGGHNEPRGEVCIWDLFRTGEEPRWRLVDPDTHTHSIAFAPDGKTVLVGQGMGKIALWAIDGDQPKRIRSVPAHRDNVGSLLFTPDGTQLISGAYDGTMRVCGWNGADLTAAETLTGHRGWVNALAFAPNGGTLYSASWDHTMRRWEKTPGGFKASPFDGHINQVSAAAFSADGKWLASGAWTDIGRGGPNEVRLWSVGESRPKLRRLFEGSTGNVNAVDFSHDGRRLAAASDAGVICWDAANGTTVGRLTHTTSPYGDKYDSPAASLAFAPTGWLLASGWSEPHVRLTDFGATPPKTVGSTDQPGHHAEALVFFPDGRHLAVASTNGGPVVMLDWSGNDLRVDRQLEGPDRVEGVAVTANGQRLAAGGRDGTVHVWDMKRPDKPLAILRGHKHVVDDVAFGDDGRSLVSGDWDGFICVWDVEKQELMFKRKAPGRIWRLVAAPDGRHFALGCGTGLVYILRFDWANLRGAPKTPVR